VVISFSPRAHAGLCLAGELVRRVVCARSVASHIAQARYLSVLPIPTTTDYCALLAQGRRAGKEPQEHKAGQRQVSVAAFASARRPPAPWNDLAQLSPRAMRCRTMTFRSTASQSVSSSCSQIRIAVQPMARRARTALASRFLFPSIFAVQNSRLVLGMERQRRQPCQKQPSKKIARRL